ncbi:hypothetical protein RIF29_31585 [Crotalaria pallida]|uniref:Uncharacterized protein n=1 Tax=Crotalaria pallida TaxID=3830 RepID=A0AAN9HVC8_CROPI
MVPFQQTSVLVPPSPPNNISAFSHNNFHRFQHHHPIDNEVNHHHGFEMGGPSFEINSFSMISTFSLSEPCNDGPNNNLVEEMHKHLKNDKNTWNLPQKIPTQCGERTQPLVGPTTSPSVTYELLQVKPKLCDEFSCMSETCNDHQQIDPTKGRKRIVKVGHKMTMIKGHWTVDEDRVLIRLVRQFGLQNWSEIAKFMNGRIGKQCRQRWYHHLRPNIKKDSWTEDEDKILIEAHKEFGNKWAKIARWLPQRTENSIKNRWHTTKQCQNIEDHENKGTKSGRALLRNYIMQVTASEKDLKKPMSDNVNLRREDRNDQGLLSVRHEGLEGDFKFEDWVIETLGRENADVDWTDVHCNNVPITNGN